MKLTHVISPCLNSNLLLPKHGLGPFSWGKYVEEMVHNAVDFEEVAFMNFPSLQLDPSQTRMQQELLDKQYLCKHGKMRITGRMGEFSIEDYFSIGRRGLHRQPHRTASPPA